MIPARDRFILLTAANCAALALAWPRFSVSSTGSAVKFTRSLNRAPRQRSAFSGRKTNSDGRWQ